MKVNARLIAALCFTVISQSASAADSANSPRVFSVPSSFQLKGDAQSLSQRLDNLAMHPDDNGIKSVLTELRQEKPLETRWFGTKGDVVAIYLAWDSIRPGITIDEEPRTTELTRGFKTLIQIAGKVAGTLVSYG